MDTTCDIRGLSLAVAPDKFPDPVRDIAPTEGEQTAVLAGGCFWCVEAVLQELKGVLAVTSGYAGGKQDTADYRSVCGGDTGHAEVVRVRFDPRQISYGQLLKVFFSVAHDPTQLDRQGNDFGTQYRSAIFYESPEQKDVAESYIAQLNAAGAFRQPIATQVTPLEHFYEAEEYHQDYADRNPYQPYVMAVAAPKVKKLRENFGEKLKKEKK